jgi:ABC-2 type transport system ATP-binding protein
MPVIEVERLSRTFRARTGIRRRSATEVEAVRDITFGVERGELFGLLGPNGAGKTTTIKMLITLLLPTSGSARVLGHDVVEEANDVRRRVGYVFGGDRGLYDRLSGIDNLRFFAELYSVPASEQHRRIDELLELVGLDGRQKERVEGYSRGMRQRLHIARGLLHRPEVLFLDEPSIGIDPVGARELRETVARLRDEGTTILLTTHYMFEADELCDRLAVISDGRIVAEGTPDELKARVADGNVLEVEVYGSAEDLVVAVQQVPGVTSVSVDVRPHAEVLVVRSDGHREVAHQVLAELSTVRIGKVSTRQPTLEDAYVDLVSAP